MSVVELESAKFLLSSAWAALDFDRRNAVEIHKSYGDVVRIVHYQQIHFAAIRPGYVENWRPDELPSPV